MYFFKKRFLIYIILLFVAMSSSCITTDITPHEIEKSDGKVKSIKIISTLDPVYTDLLYIAVARMQNYQIAEHNADATLYFTKSRIEYHGTSCFSAFTRPFYLGNVYYHNYQFSVKVVSKDKKIVYVFDNEVTRYDQNPEGGVTMAELSKIIYDTLERI